MFASPKETKTSPATDGMINEGGHTIDGIKETARHIRRDANDAAHAVKDNLEGAARRSGQYVREIADSAGQGLSEAGQTVTHKIRDNPVQSSIVALGVGVVIGMIFNRR